MPEVSIASQQIPANQASINSMIVLTLPPHNAPVIMTSTQLGLICCICPNFGVITFGAHNDSPKPGSHFQESPFSKLIVNLHKVQGFDNKFYSIAQDGLIRYWELSI